MNQKANRLLTQNSPYLLQHAYNPVDWYPWGEEAFAKAKAEDKPVFLSIGYSTCHWCHVMAHESFEDAEVAELLNRNFVPIKVDKEERPDIDAIYMSVCQALTGQGGWPLTIIMTPEQKPFFAGTYLPKKSKYHMSGLLELLENAAKQWKQNKQELSDSGDEITDAVRRYAEQGESAEKPNTQLLDKAGEQLKNSFEKQYGGFSKAPKFPTPHNLMFLLRRYTLMQDLSVLPMVEKTLQQMYRGGIFDHIGFGFSRYSTDNRWLAPHFEKMLYDNALLVIAYLEAYQITRKELYKTVAEKTLAYIRREMTAPEGGFYCAQDADSEGVEGKYYLFSYAEIQKILGEQDGEIFCRRYDITEEGNFEGKNILNLIDNDEYENMDEQLDVMCQKLYEYRLGRMKLHKDDKLLTSWNALMIAAFAKAYRVLQNEEYLRAAVKAANFAQNTLTDVNGSLRVGYREGQAFGPGHLDDYAFLAWAMLELYNATYQAEWLTQAVNLTDRMRDSFWDDRQGGFFLSDKENETLILRPKELYDGAMPSGNSVAAYLLIALSKMTGDEKWQQLADRQMSFCAGEAAKYPAGYNFFNIALMAALLPTKELVCVVSDETELVKIKSVLNGSFSPDLFVMVKSAQNEEVLQKIAPFTAEYSSEGRAAAFYLCKGHACEAPFFDIDTLKQKITQ